MSERSRRAPRARGWRLPLAAAALVVMVEIVVIVGFTTEDVPTAAPVPPRVLAATLSPGPGAGTTLRVSAQDPDGTVTGLEVEWPNGERKTISLPCDPNDFGGKTVEREITHPRRVKDAGTRVRAIAKSCFPAVPLHTGPWKPVDSGL